MNKSKEKRIGIVYTFSKEKLSEFKNTPINTRLEWLEYANSFINNTIGIKKRALVDERFHTLRVAIFRDMDDTFYDDDWRIHISDAEIEIDSPGLYNSSTPVPENIVHTSHDMNESFYDDCLYI